MGLEIGTYISDLVTTNPTGADAKSTSDDHHRLIKSTIKATFPNIAGAVTPTHTVLNYMVGVTSAVQTQIDAKGAITGQTWTGTHVLPATTSIGTVSATEISYLGGVTSAVQTQLNTLTSAKGAISGQTWTGTHDYTGATLTIATPTLGTHPTTKAYVDGTAFSGVLPGQAGNAGKFTYTDGATASWKYVQELTVVAAATNTTLTTTPTLLVITPANYGVIVTLNNASTLPTCAQWHVIDNQGEYPIIVQDSTGAMVNFVFPGVRISCGVTTASAAGVWTFSVKELVACVAQFATTGITSIRQVIAIDATRDLLLVTAATTAYLAGVIHDKSDNSFGSITTIRAVAFNSRASGGLISTDKVVVVSTTGVATDLETVVLSISGKTITPGTPATATLSANSSWFQPLVLCGASLVMAYGVVSAAQVRAITVSGTTPTVSAAAVLPGTTLTTTAGENNVFISGSVAIVVSITNSANNLFVTPYTISGSSTPAVGTGTTTTVTNVDFSNGKIVMMPSGRLFWAFLFNSASILCGFSTLSGTTITTSTTTGLTGNGAPEAIVVSSTKVMVIGAFATNNVNIITDSAGTPGAGTAITAVSTVPLYVNGTNVIAQNLASSPYTFNTYDCSGASPVVSSSMRLVTAITPPFAVSNLNMVRDAASVFGTEFAQTAKGDVTAANTGHARIRKGNLSIVGPKAFSYLGDGTASTAYRGTSEAETWFYRDGKGIFKVRCAA